MKDETSQDEKDETSQVRLRDNGDESVNVPRRRFLRTAGASAAGAMLLGMGEVGNASAATTQSAKATSDAKTTASQRDFRGGLAQPDTVAADATKLPPPITRDYAVHHEIELKAGEVEAKLDSDTKFTFMPWNNQTPGPMIRVRQGDTITLTVTNPKENKRHHNVDMHAVYGTGGGSAATTVNPGQSKTERFRCVYPGAFIYHCAVPDMDEHISRGMFGMIVVEPHDGLPKVDREFYIGQHELYTKQPFGTSGHLTFDPNAMVKEEPTYVLFNGAVDGYTSGRFGKLQAKVGETARVFMVCGGPNLTSSFHAIGNVWKRCWPQGAFANEPLNYVQTQPVPPGSCFVGDLELPVPETIKLVDHALTRVTHQGLLAEIEVNGQQNPAIYKAPA